MFNAIRNILIPNEYNRHNWIKKRLSKIENGKKILDAGCGTQRYREFCNHLNYKGQDFGKYKPKDTDEGLQTRDWEYGKLDYTGDVWSIDEKNETFDVVMCTEVLEHIPYPNETIAELSRLLKGGGELILTAPYACLPHFQPFFYYSGFSKEWYRYILDKNGFEIIEITPNGDFFTFLIQENLRGIIITNNILLKFFGLLIVVPKVMIDFILSKINKNYQLVLGYHIYAKKK